MRVPGLIRVDVVPAMVGRPADRSAFEGHGAGADQRQPQRPAGDERPVGQQAMEPHRDAVPDDEEQRSGEEHVSEVHAFAPVPDDAEDEDEERCRHEERGDRLLAEAHLRRSGGDVGRRVASTSAGAEGAMRTSTAMGAPWRRSPHSARGAVRPGTGADAIASTSLDGMRPAYPSRAGLRHARG